MLPSMCECESCRCRVFSTHRILVDIISFRRDPPRVAYLCDACVKEIVDIMDGKAAKQDKEGK